jgi:hypothetical protein
MYKSANVAVYCRHERVSGAAESVFFWVENGAISSDFRCRHHLDDGR